jgi:hypothetical protein
MRDDEKTMQLVLEFGRSNSMNYERALALAQNMSSYSRTGIGKDVLDIALHFQSLKLETFVLYWR